MFIFALITGKLAAAFLGLFGRGSDLPGRLAMKICPRFINRFKRTGKIIAVTGSNGKTTTAGMIAYALSACGKTVKSNPIGSNMTGGIATVMLRASDLRGKIDCDYLVLETDERYSRLIFADFKPDIMLVTNLFRDQITRNNNVDFIFNILDRVITPDITLVLNALDPISQRLGKEGNKRVYFSSEPSVYTSDKPLSITHDCKVCPKCKHRLGYEWYMNNHIGSFKCESCGFASPKGDFVLSRPSLSEGRAEINGLPVKMADPTLYGLYNLTAAAAVCCTAGLTLADTLAALSKMPPNKTRFDRFKAGERDGVMLLSKNQNPVSFDLSISEVLRMEGAKTVVAYINNINHTHQRDTTWLWDIAFERLVGEVENVICAGPRAYDLGVRLKYAGFDMSRVIIEPDNSGIREAVAKTKGTLYVLTELYDAKTITEAIK